MELLLILLGFLAAPYLLGPFAIKLFVTSGRNVTVRRLTEGEIPLQVLGRREDAAIEFKAIGFREIGTFKVEGLSDSMVGYLAIFASPDTNLLGALLLLESDGRLVKSYCEFEAKQAGGDEWTLVNNAGTIDFFELPDKHVRTMATNVPVRTLFLTAQEYVRRRYGGPLEELSPRCTEQELSRRFNRDNDDKLRRGMLVDRGDHLALSWKSAILYTWKCLLPGRQIVKSRQFLTPAAPGQPALTSPPGRV
jgi:hypothetical protein